MVLEADCLKLLNNRILNHYNMHLEIEKTENVHSEVFGSQESMLLLKSMIYHTLDS